MPGLLILINKKIGQLFSMRISGTGYICLFTLYFLIIQHTHTHHLLITWTKKPLFFDINLIEDIHTFFHSIDLDQHQIEGPPLMTADEAIQKYGAMKIFEAGAAGECEDYAPLKALGLNIETIVDAELIRQWLGLRFT